MTETLHNTYCTAGESEFDFPVVLSGLTITVQCDGIEIKIKGTTYTFASDEEFVVTNRAEITHLVGYIVVDTTPDPDEVRVYVDEVIEDGVDVPFDFPRGGQYDLHAYLYAVKIPAVTSDLAGIDHDRWRVQTES